MNVSYVHNARMPTEKAHGVQIVKMCEAFASLGHTVTLIVTDRGEGDVFAYYGVKESFSIVDTRRASPRGAEPSGIVGKRNIGCRNAPHWTGPWSM
jgi:hypothetical protein